ncbi:MAG: PAS domain S-box protein, partial [Solirubrobacteraceae bacterium]|nr:PAS domain S-box protein [Solirubrobacteraceae bacterium]
MSGSGASITTLMITLAVLVSLEYLLIAVYIVPRLARLADGPGSLINVAAWGAAAFFVGCSVTHLAIAVQSVRDPMMMSHHEMLSWHVMPHIAQVVGGAVFIWIASKRLDIRLAAKEVAARIQEVEARFRASFERAPIGMALVSLQPASEGRLLQANPALCAMVGGTPRQLQGRTVASLTHPDDALLLPETATEEAAEDSDLAVEKRYQHADGREVWVAVQSSVVRDHGGEPLYNVAQIRDLTEQRALESRLRQGQKMEAIGSLASGVAHDFNNVLSVIRSASGILLHELKDPGTRELVGEIDLAAEHASALTKQLLAFGRKQLLKPQPTDINEVVNETLQLVRTLLSQQIAIVRDLAPDLPLIKVDRNQFEQILLNLSANAGDAMPGGGTLTIRTRAVTLDQDYVAEHPEVEAGPFVLLEVNDSGEGLDAATVEHMFDPFFTTK